MARTAFIGLGRMGLPMALNLQKAGHTVVAFDAAQEARVRAGSEGLTLAGSLAQAVEEAEFVLTMLPAGPEARAVYLDEHGVLGHVAAGTHLLDCSTIDVATARDLAAAAQKAGCPMVDAPVSGGVAGAEKASLTFMVGGPEAAFAAAEPLLNTMGARVVHVGAAGAGQAVKLCNNMLLAISMIGTCEAFQLAESLGVDPQTFFDVVSTSSGQCWSVTSYCPVPGPVPGAPSNRDYEPGFATAMMLKDLRLAQAAGQETGEASPLGALATQLYTLMSADGAGHKDFSAIGGWLKGDIPGNR